MVTTRHTGHLRHLCLLLTPLLLVGCGSAGASSTHPAGSVTPKGPETSVGPTAPTPTAPPVSRTAAHPSSDRVGSIRQVVDLGGYLDGLAVVHGVLWAADLDGNRVVRVQAHTGHQLGTTAVPDGPLTELAMGAGVWVASYRGDRVTRLDAATGARTALVRTPSAAPCGLAAVDGRLWIFDQSDGAGILVDGASGSVLRHVSTTARSGLATFAFGSVWVPDFAGSSGKVLRLDPADGHQLGSVSTGDGPIMVTSGAGSIWVANATGDTVSRVDPGSGRVTAQVRLPGAAPVAVLVTHHSAWVTGYSSNALYRVDLSTDRVVGSLALPGPAENMVVAGGALWVTTTTGQLVAVTMAG